MYSVSSMNACFSYYVAGHLLDRLIYNHIDRDNSMVIARGKGGGRVGRVGKGSENENGKRLWLGQ